MADLFQPTGGNWKEMFYAVQSGDQSLVEYYLSQNIDPNYQHPEFLTTPLIEAAQLGKTNIVALLLANGADPAIRSEMDGWTAMEIAKTHRHKEVVALLREVSGSEAPAKSTHAPIARFGFPWNLFRR